ncbi:hypothetical protein [Campylobacter fetus]|uniref:hypothetical protein n=1 Tax=Campylobacter fetus TaxID=196 RepID=UPI00138E1309|nr:hypothetical protein [Campylobacter fetus]
MFNTVMNFIFKPIIPLQYFLDIEFKGIGWYTFFEALFFAFIITACVVAYFNIKKNIKLNEKIIINILSTSFFYIYFKITGIITIIILSIYFIINYIFTQDYLATLKHINKIRTKVFLIVLICLIIVYIIIVGSRYQ